MKLPAGWTFDGDDTFSNHENTVIVEREGVFAENHNGNSTGGAFPAELLPHIWALIERKRAEVK